MKNKPIVELSPERTRLYDELVGKTLLTMFIFSRENESIIISPFNPKKEDHLFLLGVARGLGGVVGKKIYVNANWFQVWKLNRGIDKDCRVRRIKTKRNDNIINPNEVLALVYPEAKKTLGQDFELKEIYQAYYKRKGRKKK